MENLLQKRPSMGKKRNDLLNAIVNRSRKRKPANQNQQQTRKNRNAIQTMMSTMKKNSPEYSKKQNWLSELDLLLKDQYKEADEYDEPTDPKKKRNTKSLNRKP